MPERIAFLQFGRIGDILLASAICRDLRLDNPDANITWVTFDRYRELVANCPDIDSYIAIPTPPYLSGDATEIHGWVQLKLYVEQCQHAGQFDRIVSPQCYPDHDWTKKQDVHLLDQMYEYAGVKRRDDACISIFSNVERQHINTKLITCNSRSLTQLPVWGDGQWLDLQARLADCGYELYDGDHHGHSLKEWYNLINRSAFYIGGNSGGSWMAAAAGIPQVVLRGQNQCTPQWLDSIKWSGLKREGATCELMDPSVKQVVGLVTEYLK